MSSGFPDGRITVRLEGGEIRQCAVGTPVRDLLPAAVNEAGLHYLGALVNNDVVSLSYPLEVDCDVRFLTMADSHGWRIYRRTAAYLLAKSVRELYPDARLRVEHSLGSGFYCNITFGGKEGISRDRLRKLEAHMRSLVERNLPISRRKIFFSDAIIPLRIDSVFEFRSNR